MKNFIQGLLFGILFGGLLVLYLTRPVPSGSLTLQAQNEALKASVSLLEKQNLALIKENSLIGKVQDSLTTENILLGKAIEEAKKQSDLNPTLENCQEERDLLYKALANRDLYIANLTAINTNQGLVINRTDTIITLERKQLSNCESALSKCERKSELKGYATIGLTVATIVLLLVK